MKGKDEDKHSCCRRCSQKLGELEKNGNCSSPVGGEGSTAWRGVAWQAVLAGKNGTTQRSVRDPFVYLFVNEGNETGNLIFGLCFPMAPLDVDEPHLEMRESGGQAGYRGWGLRASWAPATAGPASWGNKQGATPRNACHALLLQ